MEKWTVDNQVTLNTKVIGWLNWLDNERKVYESRNTNIQIRLSTLEKEIELMATSQQVLDVRAALDKFEAEVQADLGALVTTNTDLNTKLTAALATIAAGGTLSAEDVAALTQIKDDLTAQTTALHDKVNPPVAGS